LDADYLDRFTCQAEPPGCIELLEIGSLNYSLLVDPLAPHALAHKRALIGQETRQFGVGSRRETAAPG
jgi:hypothetical protein